MRPFASLLRRLRTSARKRLKPRSMPIGGGLRIATDRALHDDIRQALYKEHYESEELALVRRHLRPGDTVLEIGAGIGLVSVACAGICGAANVVSYEPNPGTAERIRRNFALNGMTPRLRERAVSTHDGTVTFYLNENIISSSINDRGFGGATELPCDDIAGVVAELKPSAIVMDVEGAETELLPRADLSGVRILIVELHEDVVGAGPIATLAAEMAARGFLRENPGRKVALWKQKEKA